MMAEPIIIKQEDLARVMFQDVSFKVKKQPAVNGEKAKFHLKVKWNGSLAETMAEQASMHQAKNWYNNNRPSCDAEVMSAAECLRREDYFIQLNETTLDIEAVAEGTRKQVKKHTANEVVENLHRKDLKPEEKAYWQAQFDCMQAEADEIKAAFAAIK